MAKTTVMYSVKAIVEHDGSKKGEKEAIKHATAVLKSNSSDNEKFVVKIASDGQ